MPTTLVDLALGYLEQHPPQPASDRNPLRIDHGRLAAFLRRLRPSSTAAHVSADTGGRLSIRTVEGWLEADPTSPSLESFAVLAAAYGGAVLIAAMPWADFIQAALHDEHARLLRLQLDTKTRELETVGQADFRFCVLRSLSSPHKEERGDGQSRLGPIWPEDLASD